MQLNNLSQLSEYLTNCNIEVFKQSYDSIIKVFNSPESYFSNVEKYDLIHKTFSKIREHFLKLHKH